MAKLAIFGMSNFKVQSNTAVFLILFIYRVPYFSFFHWITNICRVDKQSVIYRPGHFVYCGGGSKNVH